MQEKGKNIFGSGVSKFFGVKIIMNRENPDDYRYLIQHTEESAKRQRFLQGIDSIFYEDELFLSSIEEEFDEEWKDFIEEFDHKRATAKRVLLRDYISNPQVIPLSLLPVTEIESELDRLLDILAEHNVYIDFLGEIESIEAYRFITEELLNEEVEDIHIEGMNQHFIYEEFHPSDEYWEDDDWENSDWGHGEDWRNPF